MTELEAYRQLDCRSIEEVVNSNLQIVDKKFGEIATLFVENGYCLRRQLDEKMYEAAGYQTFEDYIKSVYGRSRSWAKRMMQINEKFSIEGNHPRIDEKYIGYSVSQLQEMLYLTDEQIQDVSPEMTVKEIREVRKPEEKTIPIERGCITGANPNGTCACCGNEGTVECCAQCQEDCNVQCGWLDKMEPCATSHKEDKECDGEGCFSCSQDCQIRQKDRYCVEAPLGNPFYCNTMNVIELLKEEMGDKCQFVNHELAYHRAGDGKAVPCCKDCDELCGYCCNRANEKRKEYEFLQEEHRATSHTEETEEQDEIPGQMHVEDYPELLPEGMDEKAGCPPNQSSCARVNWGNSQKEQDAGRKECKKCWDNYKHTQKILSEAEKREEPGKDETQEVIESAEVQQASNQNEVILEGEYKELPDERYEETTENSDMVLLKDLLDKEKYMLDALLKEYTDQDIRVRKAKIKVAALAGMLCDLEIVDPEQPELPKLKNNDQRKAFLENYKTWPVWFKVPEASEVYYRYNLPDGSSIVICEYKYYLEWKIKYHEGDPETTGTREYLLKPGYHYLHDCRANTSMLVEHLKNVLKGEK